MQVKESDGWEGLFRPLQKGLFGLTQHALGVPLRDLISRVILLDLHPSYVFDVVLNWDRDYQSQLSVSIKLRSFLQHSHALCSSQTN